MLSVPNHINLLHFQYLPKTLKEKLKVRHKNEELTIPEHIHLSQLVLPGYHRDQDLVLTSSIASSEAFQYALNALDLYPKEEKDNVQDQKARIHSL